MLQVVNLLTFFLGPLEGSLHTLTLTFGQRPGMGRYTTISHTKPYKLQWLSEMGEIIVNKQVLINFSIGKYKDEFLCDVCLLYTSPSPRD